MCQIYPVTNAEIKRVTQFISRHKNIHVGKIVIQDDIIFFRENKDWYKIITKRTPKPIEELIIGKEIYALTQDVCASCGGHIRYHHDDNPTFSGNNNIYYSYTCDDCGKDGKKWYELNFFYNQPKGQLK